MAETLWFADLALAMEIRQCDWCGEFTDNDTLTPTDPDGMGVASLCRACVEAAEKS